MVLWVQRSLPVFIDLLILLAAGTVSMLLWTEGIGRPGYPPGYPWLLLVDAVPFLASFTAFGLYRRLWRYASVHDFLAMLGASVVAGVALFFLPYLPRGPLALYWLLASVGLGAARFGVRVWWELTGRIQAPTASRVLIAGAGDAGVELTRELLRHPNLGLVPVGFVDDDPAKQGLQAHGLKVMGPCRDAAALARRLGASEVIIAMPSAPGPSIRAVWSEVARQGIAVRIVPPVKDLARGRLLASQVRGVQVEDLLGRPEIRFETDNVREVLEGKTVLVTGAGGSIGSELCRQVARLGPAGLVVVGHGENSLFHILGELAGKHPELPLCPAVGDIQDHGRMQEIFLRHRPAVVFHAAAHKHVPLMESNPAEAIKNNVIGTYHVANAALLAGAERFVLISTDKAVNPTSIMGATKRTAERVVQALAGQGSTIFVTVRFGNVLGSRGSVVPIFQEQIAAGGPVTVTHPEATRFFMTIPEAARLVIQAAAMGRNGDLFLLDMGEPVRILDLAHDLIRLAGLEPGISMPLAFTGLRPGEKLHEELFTADEETTATRHARIYHLVGSGDGRPDLSCLLDRCRRLVRECPGLTSQAVLARLKEIARGGTATDGEGSGPAPEA